MGLVSDEKTALTSVTRSLISKLKVKYVSEGDVVANELFKGPLTAVSEYSRVFCPLGNS